MEQTTTILLIILGSVSGILILLLIFIGYYIWKLVSTLQKIASIFSDEANHFQKIVVRARNKIQKILE